MEEFRAIVSGRVQMVMMRDFTRRCARALGLTGYVKNLSDGTMEVVAQGERPALAQLIEKLRAGPTFSRVEKVDIEWRESQSRYKSFTIEY